MNERTAKEICLTREKFVFTNKLSVLVTPQKTCSFCRNPFDAIPPAVRASRKGFGKIAFRRAVVVLLRASKRKLWSSKLYCNTAGIRREGHAEFKVLRCSSAKCGSKASV